MRLKGPTLPTRLRKIRKQRGSRFHGWGQVGQHRKTGGKGGAGKAGLHKHKWTWTVKFDPGHFGEKGFTTPTTKRDGRWVNVGQLDSFALGVTENKEKAGIINLFEMGYDKLLGQGQVQGTYKIIVGKFSEKAKRKIEEAGGSIEVRVK